MVNDRSIVTVGFSPCWDITCQVDGVKWGDHKQMDSQVWTPAGKALNISRALAQLKVKSTAAGLWGKNDSRQLLEEMRSVNKLIDVNMSKTYGQTRQHITIVDTKNKREMHLRTVSDLANMTSIKSVRKDLKWLVSEGTLCVFAGSMPAGKLIRDILLVVETVQELGGKVVLDTSGDPLERIIALGGISVIKPNLEELSELLGQEVKDTPAAITKAVQPLLEKVETIIVSRGQNGAIAITRKGAVQAKHTGAAKQVSCTVGCGDYLLAGYLAGIKETADVSAALEKGVRMATAKAWGKPANATYEELKKQIAIQIKKLK